MYVICSSLNSCLYYDDDDRACRPQLRLGGIVAWRCVITKGKVSLWAPRSLSCVHALQEAPAFCWRTVLHLLFQRIIANGISIFMQNSFFVARLLEVFSSPSVSRWPFGQCEFLISREISLCPFFCLNHSPSSSHIHSFLSWISICCSIFSVHKLGRMRWTNAFEIFDLSKYFHSKMMAGEIASSLYLSGEEEAHWEIFLQNDGLWCQCLFQENKKCVCGELEELKNVCRYRWLFFGIHNWGDNSANFVSLAFENPNR